MRTSTFRKFMVNRECRQPRFTALSLWPESAVMGTGVKSASRHTLTTWLHMTMKTKTPSVSTANPTRNDRRNRFSRGLSLTTLRATLRLVSTLGATPAVFAMTFVVSVTMSRDMLKIVTMTPNAPDRTRTV